jgi:endonuclease YncB( thermonuclease family)
VQLIRPLLRAVANMYRATVVAGVNRSRRRRGVPPLDCKGRRQLAGLTLLCGLMASCALSATATTGDVTYCSGAGSRVTTTSPTRAPSTSLPPTSTAEAEPVGTTDGEGVRVSRIIDGDTFELADGRRVRPLGIDSCESDTPGGASATTDAQVLSGDTVTLTAEPGVDLDGYERLLRYVHHDQIGDFGEYMVRFDHTGIYQGANDASEAYLDRLYAKDLEYAANPPSGRECGEYPPPAPANDDDSVYVPLPDNNDDRESRFCRKRWWC